MTTVYFIGGAPRCGKTTVLNRLLAKKPMFTIATDAIRDGVCRLEDTILKTGCSNDEKEGIWSWEVVVGALKHYEWNSQNPIVVEGIQVTPERVKQIAGSLPGFKPRAVFLGFLNESYIPVLLKRCENFKHCWVGHELNKEGGRQKMEDLFQSQLKKMPQMKANAEKYGYNFFTAEQWPENAFETYLDTVTKYLLGE